MKKNITIAALVALLLVSLISGLAAGQTPPGNKPDALIKSEERETTQVTAKREIDAVTGAAKTVSEVSIPFTILLRDPITNAILRELPIKATVPLARLSNKNQGTELFLADAKAKLKTAVKLAGVTLSDPEIEGYDILVDGNGDITSVPMLINVRVTVGSFYSERVRLEGIEGMNYTLLDPFATAIDDYIADIESRTLTVFSQ